MAETSYVINTFSYIWQLSARDCLAHLADQGYQRFEILLAGGHLWPAECPVAEREALAGFLAARDLGVVSVNAGSFDNNLASPAANVRAFTVEHLSGVIDLAGDLGAAAVVVSPGLLRPLLAPPMDRMLMWFRDGMEQLVPRAADRGVRILIENIPSTFLPRADQIADAIADLPAETVGIVYDVANAVFVREDPVAGLARVAPRLGLVHLSDTPLDVWRHDPVGTGVVPFGAFGTALRDIDYRHPTVVEIISTNADRDIRSSIEALGRLGW